MLFFLQSSEFSSGKIHVLDVHYLTSTHHSFGGPAAHYERRKRSRPPRTPARDSVPCTPGLCVDGRHMWGENSSQEGIHWFTLLSSSEDVRNSSDGGGVDW